MGLFGRRVVVEEVAFPQVVANLARSLETLREEFYFGSLSQLRREGIDVSPLPVSLPSESEADDALKGFQLTSCVGIAWKYIPDARAKLGFGKLLGEQMSAPEGSRAEAYHDRYLDCRGDIEALARTLALDVHSALGSPEPAEEFLLQFNGGANILLGLSQLWTYTACGDEKMAKKVKRHMGLR